MLGIGGTGVVTVNQIISTAAFIEEKKVSDKKSLIRITESLSLVIKSWKHSTQYTGLTRFLI